MKKACLALAAAVAVSVVYVFPETADAASASPVQAQARLAISDNWVDNAVAPAAMTAGASAMMVLLKEAAAETLGELRVIADLVGSDAAFQSANR